uniref:receptor protein-tyrosine kinase n=1 Tax=Timema monikensis TaxID=170555 RepID=A0A7R9HPV0_9NEOP|nr:unnamed protein product [Timema monikensis]
MPFGEYYPQQALIQSGGWSDSSALSPKLFSLEMIVAVGHHLKNKPPPQAPQPLKNNFGYVPDPQHAQPGFELRSLCHFCIGTNGRMSVPSNREHHYRNLRDRYTNCTYVDGNLELTWLQDETLDLSFLQYIREVTGYVLISHVDVRRIVLPRLQIIRGRTLFKLNIHDEDFALIATLSKMHNLEMPSLRDILNGSVGLFNNYNLCHMRTINWTEIITGPRANYVYVYNFTSKERDCLPCHKSCERGCWGEGPHNCQKFSKINCSPQCSQGRCFGSEPRDCCHLFCAGGCRGPRQSDCLACHNFYDDGVCTLECPAMQRYNPITYSWEINPEGKYAYGATCVKKCPEHLLKDNGACVRSCPESKMAVNGECVPCSGACPKTCEAEKEVHSGNIENFKDCTIIEGNLQILDQSFKGFQQVYANFSFGPRYEKMHPDRLEVFSTLREVTGFVNIQGYHQDFTNLSYFRNLEVIGGRALTEYFSSLYIVKTSLKFLGLRSLKKIHSGSVAILENKNLCFAKTINWTKIKKSSEHGTLDHNNKAKDECIAEGLVCDPECSADGCWGPGPDQCLTCKNFQLANRCLRDCDSVSGMYKAAPKLCQLCHDECLPTCHGPGPGNCTSCKHVRDGPFCTQSCPISKYNDHGECKPCHENCLGGCTGPGNSIGLNACRSCEKAVISDDATVKRCLHKNETCPDGYFYEWVGPQEQGVLRALAGRAICRKCHPRCKKCTGYGFHEQVCQECSAYKSGEQCEDECPNDHYADEDTSLCLPCSLECRSCFGPEVSQCHACRNYRVYLNGMSVDNNTAFNCTAQCPLDAPHKIFPQDSDPYCSAERGEPDSQTVPLTDIRDLLILDEKELIRNLSSAMDGPEALVDADEYLQPKSRAPLAPAITTSNSSSTPPPTPTMKSWPDGTPVTAESPTPQNQQNWDREHMHYAGNGVHPMNQVVLRPHGSDSSSSRYCSDPLNGRDCDVLQDDCFDGNIPNNREAQVGTLKLDLPLDEDDYLMPSPQQSQNTTTYMDIIGESKVADNTEPRNGFRNYPDFLPLAGKTKTSVDNPEYIMSHQDHVVAQDPALGIPTTDVEQPVCNGNVEGQRPYVTQQKSSEEESDHEYYNDFDRLQRELQPLKPLRRNETTV